MLRREFEKPGESMVTVIIDGLYVEVGTAGQYLASFIPDEADRLARFRGEVRKCLRAGFKESARSSGRREFILDDGRSRKFWGIELDGDSHVVYFGRIGTKGREKAKSFPTVIGAQKDRDKLISAKLRGGYVEVKH